MKQETIMTKKIEESGQVGVADSVVAMVTLIVGVAIAILMLIFTGALAGQTWNLVEPDIENISDAAIQASIEAAVTSGFEALEQTGNYLPLIVLAVITALIIGIILSFANFGTQRVGGGSVL